MANLLVTVEMDVEEILHRIEAFNKALVSPRALMALAILAVPLGQAIESCILAGAQEGLNIPLDITSAELLVKCWPELKAYLESLAIQPSKGTS
jgi:hypothetical protein